MKHIFVLSGEGIECERESLRFFRAVFASAKVEEVPVPLLLKKPERYLNRVEQGDLFFVPGGFSFADHFGSGLLMAFHLNKAKIFEKLIQRSCHIMGVCNGFQILACAGLFGEGVSLQHNRQGHQEFGFINRWVRVKGVGVCESLGTLSLCVRHGEGRLQRLAGVWPDGVQAFLKYDDPFFDNGSVEQTAGLLAQHGRSWVVGMMPHPEVALREIDMPSAAAADFVLSNPQRQFSQNGPGIKLIQQLYAIWQKGDRHA